MRDPMTEDYKVKLYKDKEGNLKGDGLCCYLKVGFVFLVVCHKSPSEIYVPAHVPFMLSYSLVMLHHFMRFY